MTSPPTALPQSDGADAAVETDELVGTLLDKRYRVVERLGEGGMGLVYRATHEILKSNVAIKVLRREASSDEESLERLQREAQSASAIGNEHIVDVRDFGRLPNGMTYVVMEMIEGVDLLTEVRLHTGLPWRRAVHLAMQVCEALGAAHEAGIVHRDLKPENIILTTHRGEADFVKVVDFGIAKVAGTSKLTAAGRVMGTPEYMSPEQCAGVSVDHRTDIYALGVLLYEMVTAKLPFYHRDLAKLVRMQMQDAPIPPRERRPQAEIPKSLETVILRLLEKNPKKRLRSMGDVSLALAAVLEGAPLPVVPDSTSLDDASVDDPIPAGLHATRMAVRSPADMPSSPASPTPASVVAARPTHVDKKKRSNLLPYLLAGAGVLAGVGVALGVAATRGEPTADPVQTPGRAVAPTEVAAAGTEPPVIDETTPSESAPPGRAPTIELASSPPNAMVFQDGALIGTTPVTVPRPASGERLMLTLRLADHEESRVALSSLSSDELRVNLAPERAPVRRGGGSRPGTAPAVHEATPTHSTPGTASPEPHREFRDPWAN